MNSFNEFLETIKMGYFKNQYNILKYHSNYLSMNDEFGLNVIHWVCLLNNVDILQILLNENCDIEARGKNGWRAIHFATFMGHTDIVKRLIETYCEIDCKTDNNETPLDIANGKSNHEFIDKIFYKTTCLKIALKMGFKCGSYCEHRYCLITTLSDIKMDPKISKIGKGTFGKIYQIGDNFNEKTFACKRMKKTKLFKKKWKNNILPCINDYLWPSMINHAKILTYYGSLEIGDRILLIMEHMQKGSIEDIIKSKELLSETKILQYTKDILQGLAFLHKQNIIHRRVKPSHMLINERDECKLSISSLSRLLVHEDIDEEFNLKDISPGTLNFLAPEIINGENYNLPVDIWSLGCSLINMLTGYPPYYQFNEYQLCFLIGTVKKIEFEVHSSISDGLKCLIGKMLNAEIDHRLTVKNLLMSLLFKNLSNIEFDQSNNAFLGDEFNLNTDKEPCKKIIQYAIDNQEAGKVMGFMCAGRDCNHKLCLSSVTATNFKKDKVNKGGYGTVYKSAESNSNRVFAIKRLDCATNDDIRYVENKIDKYKHLINHDRIIKYYGAIKNDKYFFIFMKYMEHGSLTDEIKKMGGFLSEETIKKYSKQILEGVAYLHSNNICHRDIKSDNILINELGNIEIADFGFSRIFTPESIFSPKSMCGTKCYMSPEMRCGENYNFETDIWSVGATVYEMSTGKTPCMETTPNFLFKNQLSFVINYPDNLSKKVKQFLDLMLQCNPKKRATATELLGNKFLNTSFNKKKSLRRYFCIFKK